MKEFWGNLGQRLANAVKSAATWTVTYKVRIAACVGTIGLVTVASVAGNAYVERNTIDVWHVYVNEHQAGTVSDPQIIESYVEQRYKQLEEQYPQVHMVLNDEDINFEKETSFKPKTDDDGAIQNLAELLEPKSVGVALKINGETVGIVKDQETADAILNQIKLHFTAADPDEAVRNVRILSEAEAAEAVKKRDSEYESIEFVEEVDVDVVESFDPGQVADPQELVDKLITGDVAPTVYVVKEGDCISCIASKLDISEEEIRAKNPHIENDNIYIGDELDVTILQPHLSVKTEELVEELHDIQYETIYKQDDELKMGKTVVEQQGVNGKQLLTFKLTKINGIEQEQELINKEIIEEATPAIVRRGTKVIPGEGTGSFAWPVSGAKISSSYGMRWGSLHKGIDLTSKNKTIKASDNGKVIHAGEKSGYGNTVIIDHNNGYQTLYAHLKSISVSEGSVVEKGEEIGIMGSTGNSTGVHLHFEVLKNGTAQNPVKYLP
ncbi:M23 family peptidase [Xylanibacillus composti]|uniref:Metalloendopeptidase n=1 Tax=Xylanibacillus composti TaxID=1572762 RepID=A0A8J4M358_9BACL|nr:M23 family metallopeptidase [Xylanibacillus composti]MDT9725259.1 M23 family peptidase [Xylanibacillus composti]GIQ70459.1 metalloendopeptidase [Xylanibacillus composti]